jgi:hypothetical protein
MLIHPDRLDAVEPAGVVDQDPLALGQDRVIGGVPRNAEPLSDPRHGQVATHDPFQRPPQPPTRQLRPRLRRPGGVLTPHMPTPATPVPAHRDLQHRRAPPQRLVRQPTHHGVAEHPLATATAAPPVRLGDPASKHRTPRLEPLPDHLQTQLIDPAERRQVRAGEGSVGHVEVFRMVSVRTPIIGRPRPLSRDRRAHPSYTVNCDEPLMRHRSIPPDRPMLQSGAAYLAA